MQPPEVKKIYIEADVPAALSSAERIAQAIWGMAGGVLSPIYWLIAHLHGAPGLQFHRESAWLGMKLLLKRRPPTTLGSVHHLLFFPMDSTRYFEFDFAWQCFSSVEIHRYLDVSSPRLFPALLVNKHRNLRATLINPDKTDLAITANLMIANGLATRCEFYENTIETAPLPPETFDAITSISVIEHIPDDLQAVRSMWKLLRPGGRLFLSVPCAAEACDQYINVNYYDLPMDQDGFVLFQHIYDEARLRENIFSITGQPVRFKVYGEKRNGFLAENRSRKRSDRVYYPFWREPFTMGREFKYFDSITALPGEGVMGLEFIKS